MKQSLLLTIDVEDWFQVENFKSHIDYSEWDRLPSRVHRNTLELLDLFGNQKFSIKATFFILGWVAEKCPDLVREISKRGHEVASHGYAHNMCTSISQDALFADLVRSKQVLEKITGKQIAGYRAPSFSINNDTLGLVQKAGYLYDSSYNSFSRHGRYGSITTRGRQRQGIAYIIDSGFYELPVSNLKLHGQTIPWGGGGYFRLLPFNIFKRGVRTILSKQNVYIFYMHPWEIDPQQPRVKNIKRLTEFRHYLNLEKAYGRLHELINTFQHCRFISASQYLQGQACL